MEGKSTRPSARKGVGPIGSTPHASVSRSMLSSWLVDQERWFGRPRSGGWGRDPPPREGISVHAQPEALDDGAVERELAVQEGARRRGAAVALRDGPGRLQA